MITSWIKRAYQDCFSLYLGKFPSTYSRWFTCSLVCLVSEAFWLSTALSLPEACPISFLRLAWSKTVLLWLDKIRFLEAWLETKLLRLFHAGLPKPPYLRNLFEVGGNSLTNYDVFNKAVCYNIVRFHDEQIALFFFRYFKPCFVVMRIAGHEIDKRLCCLHLGKSIFIMLYSNMVNDINNPLYNLVISRAEEKLRHCCGVCSRTNSSTWSPPSSVRTSYWFFISCPALSNLPQPWLLMSFIFLVKLQTVILSNTFYSRLKTLPFSLRAFLWFQSFSSFSILFLYYIAQILLPKF